MHIKLSTNMATKTYKSTVSVERKMFDGACGGSKETVLVETMNTTITAVFSRAKPRPLTPTPMKIVRNVRNGNTYRGTVMCREYGDVGFAFSNQVPYVVRRADPSASQMALTQNAALAKFGDGSFNAGIFLAESKQTGSFVLSALQRVSGFTKRIKRGDFLGAADVLTAGPPSRRSLQRLERLPASKRLANGWLEYQYALKPLINDVYGAIEAYHSTIVEGQQIVRSSGPTRKQVAIWKDNQLRSNENGVRDGGNSYRLFPSVPPRVTVGGTVKSTNLRTLQELGLINLAALAWEKMPFSFVIDWFIPVGDYLKSFSATVGMSNVWMCTTVEKSEDYYYNQRRVWGGGTTTVNRTVQSPKPRLPTLTGDHLSGTRLTTLAALIRQRIQ